MIIDTHAHYDDEAFDTDRKRFLRLCTMEGLRRL